MSGLCPAPPPPKNIERTREHAVLPYDRKDPLPFPFSKRSPVSGLRQTKKQMETGVKRIETVGVYPLAHRRGTANSPLNLSEKLSALIE